MKGTIEIDLEEFLDYDDNNAKNEFKRLILNEVKRGLNEKLNTDIVKEIQRQVTNYIETTFKKEVSKCIKKAAKEIKFRLDGKDYSIEEWIKNRFAYKTGYYSSDNSQFAKEIEAMSKTLVENCFEQFKKEKRQEVMNQFEQTFMERMMNNKK